MQAKHVLCTFCAAKSIFVLFFLRGYSTTVNCAWFLVANANCCAGCHPWDLWRCSLPPYPHVSFFLGLTNRIFARCFAKRGGRVHTSHFWTSKGDEPSMLVSKVFPFSNRCALIWTPSKQTIFGSSYSPGVSPTRTCAPTQRFSEMRSSAGMELVTRLLPRPWVILFELYRETQSTHRSGWKSTFEHMGRWSNGICTWRHRKDGYFL